MFYSVDTSARLCFLIALRTHLADFVFHDNRTVFLNDESARAYIDLVLQGFQTRSISLEPNLYN
jgi:hypothetical protein